jgi:hypothetical protein
LYVTDPRGWNDPRERLDSGTSAAALSSKFVHAINSVTIHPLPSGEGSTLHSTSTMIPQAPLRVVSPPTTLSKSYLPSDYAQSTATFMAETSHYDAVRISRATDLGSTAKGIMIGIFSVLGAAGVCLIIASIVYYFRYTQQGRIFLDRLSRPGEYDDEQQFAKEEAEALEEMDDLQRMEYMRAKGTSERFIPGLIYW